MHVPDVTRIRNSFVIKARPRASKRLKISCLPSSSVKTGTKKGSMHAKLCLDIAKLALGSAGGSLTCQASGAATSGATIPSVMQGLPQLRSSGLLRAVLIPFPGPCQCSAAKSKRRGVQRTMSCRAQQTWGFIGAWRSARDTWQKMNACPLLPWPFALGMR